MADDDFEDLFVEQDEDDGDDFEAHFEAHYSRHLAANSSGNQDGAQGSPSGFAGSPQRAARPQSASRRDHRRRPHSALVRTPAHDSPRGGMAQARVIGRERPASAARAQPALVAAAQSPPMAGSGAAAVRRRRQRRRPASAAGALDSTGRSRAASPVQSRGAGGTGRRARPSSALPIPYGSSKQKRSSMQSTGQGSRTKTRRGMGGSRPASAPVSHSTQPRTSQVARRSSVASTESRTVSVQHLRAARAKAQAEEDSFAAALLAEEREQLQAAHARITQANLWASALGTGRNYRTLMRQHGGDGQGAGDVETRVIVHTADGKNRDISLDIFTREYEKLQHHVKLRRQAGLLNSGSGASGAGQGAGSSPSRGGTSAGGGPGAKVKASGSGAIMGTYTVMLQHHAGAHAAKKKLSKSEVQSELQSVLRETARLTAVLQQQLDELKSKGWNVTRVV